MPYESVSETFTVPDYAFAVAGAPLMWQRLLVAWMTTSKIEHYEVGEFPRPICTLEFGVPDSEWAEQWGPLAVTGLFVFTPETMPMREWEDGLMFDLQPVYEVSMPIPMLYRPPGVGLSLGAVSGQSGELIATDIRRRLEQARSAVGVL